MRKRIEDLPIGQQLLRHEREAARLLSLVQERIKDMLGDVFDYADVSLADDSLHVVSVPESFVLSETVQEKIYDMGFKRIYVTYDFVNGKVFYFYCGGDPRGYRK